MASEHLIKITNKAKQLRRANPKLKWTDAVKKASKLIKPAAKKAAPKKRAVAKKVSGVKKRAVKKPVTKTHKDTKSHNVNIRVVSGVNEKSEIDTYKKFLDKEKELTRKLQSLRLSLKASKTPLMKQVCRKGIMELKYHIAAVKQQKAIQKKLI